jgi:hypothetical protein
MKPTTKSVDCFQQPSTDFEKKEVVLKIRNKRETSAYNRSQTKKRSFDDSWLG